MTFNDVRHTVVRLAGEACQGVEGDGKGLSGRGLRINRRGPRQYGLQRKSVLLQMFPGGLGV